MIEQIAGTPWTPEEDRKLIEMFNAGNGFAAIMASLPGRGRKGVENRLILLRRDGKISGFMAGSTHVGKVTLAAQPEVEASRNLLVAMLRAAVKNDWDLGMPFPDFAAACREHGVVMSLRRIAA